jgi:DNA-directed RNA polymerase specialized sigma24 family protein
VRTSSGQLPGCQGRSISSWAIVAPFTRATLVARSSTAPAVQNLGGWLTTIVARVCLDMLRSRTSRREEPLDGYLPEDIASSEEGTDPSTKRCWFSGGKIVGIELRADSTFLSELDLVLLDD